ncbi:MAG: M23 family metallopeptidase [Patescibacteria group bacterium]|nr:M23 family metallopeptidase [Patescibacteria group bacterium]
MKKNKLKIFLLVSVSLFLFCLAKNALALNCAETYPNDGECLSDCEGAAADKSTGLCPANLDCCHQYTEPVRLQLQVPIFGYTKANNLTEYISILYQDSLYLIILLAIIVIIYAGILWITSAGDRGKIAAAKKYIIDAIIGLIIAFLGGFILSLVGITQITMPGVNAIPTSTDEVLENTPPEQNPGYESIGGQCFPVASDSFDHISWNYGNRRKCLSSNDTDFRRCHGGIDIYTKAPGNILAMADGVIVGMSKTFYKCSFGWGANGVPSAVGKFMIKHGNYTVNYGEIDADKMAPGLGIGSQVKAGQFLGQATYCGMLHFELYQGELSNNIAWPPAGQSCLNPALPFVDHICLQQPWIAFKPAAMLDPTETLQTLQSRKCSKLTTPTQ